VNIVDIFRLSDDELIARTVALARSERAASCDLVEHLAEIDRRDLALKRTSMSLFEFCVHRLKLSDDAAYRRIRAARAIKKFPPISVLFREGQLSLETISQLHPFLDDPDAAALVKRCIGLRKWQVQAVLAERRPESARRDVIRYRGPVIAATPKTELTPAPLFEIRSSPAPNATPVVPTVEEKKTPPPTPPAPSATPIRVHAVRVSFSADAEFHQLMRKAQALLRHKYPDGRLGGVLKDALIALLKKKDLGFGWKDAAAARR